MRTHIDLFSGIGGFALAAHWNGFKTVQFCEREPYCQAVLAKHWPGVPICDDIHKLRGTYCDLLTGGFPCQPYSIAGKRRGSEDDRALWPEMLRVIKEGRPRWVVGENVTGFINMELDRCIDDLEAVGYSCETLIIPACAVGANHRRDRVWILANAVRGKQKMGRDSAGVWGVKKQVAGNEIRKVEMESHFCRSHDGIPRALDRLKSLGNAIVPQVAEEIIRCILEVDAELI